MKSINNISNYVIKEFINKYPFINVIFGHETDEFKIEYR